MVKNNTLATDFPSLSHHRRTIRIAMQMSLLRSSKILHRCVARHHLSASLLSMIAASTTPSAVAFVSPVCYHAASKRGYPCATTFRQTHTATAEIIDRLNFYPPIPDDVADCMSSKEWEQRCALAVAYRIAHVHDWHENIFNHITLKVDGSDDAPDGPHFLLNDFGIGFDEITACNLLKVNLDGMIVQPAKSFPTARREINPGQGRVFKPGYVL